MSEEWLNAHDARERVVPGCRHNDGRTDSICRRANAGLVKTRASIFVMTRVGEKTETRDHAIPADFWGGDPLTQNWVQGDFSTWMRSEGCETHFEAYGVTFELSGIQVMAPQSSGEVVSSQFVKISEPSNVGRPAKANWEQVMIEMARQLFIGDLQPKVQADIETAIAGYLSGRRTFLSESTIREHARPLWQAIQSEAGK